MAAHHPAADTPGGTPAPDAGPSLAHGVHLERRDRVAVITVSDPERRNAMAVDLAVDLAAALVELIGAAEADDGVGAVVVTGASPAFCAGADLLLGPQGAAAATLFGEILDAREAERVGLAWRAVADPVAAAVAMATTAAEAPRDLAVTTKRTPRATANLDARSDALEMEIRAQLASLESPVFAERLASLRARTVRRG